jgi:hypothetical protein
MLKFLTPLLIFLSETAYAEVADKVPSVWTNIGVSLASIIIGLILIRFYWWLFPVSLLLVGCAHAPILIELYDAAVGPAIRTELGEFYFWQPQISATAGIIFCVVFAFTRNRQRSQK